MINITNLLKKLFFLLGLFCTFIALKFGGGVALFNYIILLIIIIQFIIKRRLYFYIYKIPMYLFVLLMPTSIILNWNNIDRTLISDGIGITIKFIIFILPIVILFSDEELYLYRKNFFSGLYLASWIQCVWGTMQIILYHINGIFLNQLVFENLLHIKLEDMSWINLSSIGIRPTGIGWEPAVYGISLVFGFAYTNKIYYKLLFGAAILSSTSSTGILALIVLIIYEGTINVFVNRKNRKKEINRKKSNYIVEKIAVCTVILIVLITIMCSKFITSNLMSYADVSVQRLIKIVLGQNSEETSTNIHMLYYQKLIPTLFSGNVIQWLLGYGNFIVGRLYSSLYGVYSSSTAAWNPESDFVTILLGTGILGCVLYYFIILKGFLLCNDTKLKKYLVIIVTCGFSYLFVRGTFTFLIIVFLMIKENDKKLIA